MRRLLLVAIWLCIAVTGRAEPLPKTKPLTRDGDLAMQMVEGIDRYLNGLSKSPEAEVEAAAEAIFPKKSKRSEEAWEKALPPHRERLRTILGVVENRVPFTDLEYVSRPRVPAQVADTRRYTVWAVRWPVLPGVDGEGLLLEPKGKAIASVVALPDADWTPEMLIGMAPGVAKEAQFARRLAESGCRVLVPVLIDRHDTWSGSAAFNRWTNQPHREFIYRMAFEMGRHPIGYETQKVLAAVDWFAEVKDHPPIGVFGYGEGGLIALCAGALDSRIRATCVSGAFYLNAELALVDQQPLWEQPIYRNLFGTNKDFSPYRLLLMARNVGIDYSNAPKVTGPPLSRDGRRGAAPGSIVTPAIVEAYIKEEMRQGHVSKGSDSLFGWFVCESGLPGSKYARAYFLHSLSIGDEPKKLKDEDSDPLPTDRRKSFDPAPRQHRQFDQLVAFTQKLMRDSEARRAETFWAKLDTSTPEKYAASTEPFRKQLWEEVIGKLPAPTLAMNPQSRPIYDEPKWTGHEVTLDLYPDVFAYGILLLPKDMKPGEKRPVVVCQHGLEGRPQDVCNPKVDTRAYHSFGAKLADKGYIVFAPQNPYIGGDKFRVLQRKANPLGLSIFSFIVRQHERILDWLVTLPNVDADRIAFYGLSYGGKTAMRVPAILPRYCLSICSGDFNEWIWKNVSVDYRGSYMFSGEYEMPEFNLGHTFGYAEMAALIAPRPFMVERGHNDSVGIDEWVAYEYAKVRRHYNRLKLSDKTEIEFFDGPHEIHGVGTFRFLEKHLGR